MDIQFVGLPSDRVADLRQNMRDAYDNSVEVHSSDGDGNPCRHCLHDIAHGNDMLVLAYRPFASTNPYAETGPIFLCGDACPAAEATGELPAILTSPSYLVRGYTDDERIRYGSGKVVATVDIADYARTLFETPEIAFVHVRSASNNCFQCRIERR